MRTTVINSSDGTSAERRARPRILKQPTMKVDDGTRTHDRLDHNQELYQLSYAHRETLRLAPPTIDTLPASPRSSDG